MWWRTGLLLAITLVYVFTRSWQSWQVEYVIGKQASFVFDLSSSSPYLASANLGDSVIIWNLNSGSKVHVLRGHSSNVSRVFFVDDGTRLVSCGFDGEVRIWDTKSGQCLKVIKLHEDQIITLIYSPRIEVLATGSWGHTVALLSLTNFEDMKRLEGHSSMISDLEIFGDGNLMVSTGLDGKAILWNMETGEKVAELISHKDKLTDISISPEKDQAVTGGFDGPKVWDLKSGSLIFELDRDHADLQVAYSPDGKVIATADDSEIRIWDSSTGILRHTLSGHAGLLGFSWTGEKDRILSWGTGRTARIWDTSRGSCLAVLSGHPGWVNNAILVSDDRIATSSGRRESAVINIWRRARPEYYWGVLYLPHFWIATLLFALTIWSALATRPRRLAVRALPAALVRIIRDQSKPIAKTAIIAALIFLFSLAVYSRKNTVAYSPTYTNDKTQTTFGIPHWLILNRYIESGTPPDPGYVPRGKYYRPGWNFHLLYFFVSVGAAIVLAIPIYFLRLRAWPDRVYWPCAMTLIPAAVVGAICCAVPHRIGLVLALVGLPLCLMAAAAVLRSYLRAAILGVGMTAVSWWALRIYDLFRTEHHVHGLPDHQDLEFLTINVPLMLIVAIVSTAVSRLVVKRWRRDHNN